MSSPFPQIYGTPEHPYSTVPETKEDLPWAELVALDLSIFDQPGGKEILAKELKKGVNEVGFFYVVNFGISQERVDKQFEIGKEFFDLPASEKKPYAADLGNGGYNGYTSPDLDHFKKQDSDVIRKDSNIEVMNIPKFTPEFDEWHASHKPAPLAANWEEIKRFGKDVHANVIRKLLVIFAHVLELENENHFLERHRYDVQSEDHFRYMKYAARSDEANEKFKGLYIDGHTDLGSITLLFRQPVAGLQVRSHDGYWTFVKPLPGSITVNIADTLQILSGTYFKSSIHRVVAPQADQVHYDRLGVLYFVRPNNQVLVEAVKNSPVLAAEGLYEKVKDEAWEQTPISVQTWVKARQAAFFSIQNPERYEKLDERSVPDGTEKKELTHIVAGIPVKYWA